MYVGSLHGWWRSGYTTLVFMNGLRSEGGGWAGAGGRSSITAERCHSGSGVLL